MVMPSTLTPPLSAGTAPSKLLPSLVVASPLTPQPAAAISANMMLNVVFGTKLHPPLAPRSRDTPCDSGQRNSSGAELREKVVCVRVSPKDDIVTTFGRGPELAPI